VKKIMGQQSADAESDKDFIVCSIKTAFRPDYEYSMVWIATVPQRPPIEGAKKGFSGNIRQQRIHF
jgi:hypothetical protein